MKYKIKKLPIQKPKVYGQYESSMTFRFIILFFVFLFAISPLFSQERSEGPGSQDKKNEMSDKFFLALSTSTYTDVIITPLRYFYIATGNFTQGDSINPSVPIFASVPFQSTQFNIISLGMEPRYNLKEFNQNVSLSVSAPISFGIGTAMPSVGQGEIVRGIDGFGSIQVPVLLKLNSGNGSTYTTQKDFGFSIGAGMEINKIGLINLTSTSKQYNKAFVLPGLSAGVTFMRGSSPMEINFKYSFGQIKLQETDSQGDLLKENGVPYKRSTKAQTIKLSFVYLLNY